MVIQCPKCRSLHITTKNYARKTGGTIGTVAGTTSGVVAVLGGARTGAAVGMLFGPIGASIGSISGAVVAGLLGGAAGGSAGVVLGEFIDDNILNNYYCLSCGTSFNRSTKPQEEDDIRTYHQPQLAELDESSDYDHDEEDT